jgi:hypothetical protein
MMTSDSNFLGDLAVVSALAIAALMSLAPVLSLFQ